MSYHYEEFEILNRYSDVEICATKEELARNVVRLALMPRIKNYGEYDYTETSVNIDDAIEDFELVISRLKQIKGDHNPLDDFNLENFTTTTKIGEVDMTELQEIEERLKNIEGIVMKNYHDDLTLLKKRKDAHNQSDDFDLEGFKNSLVEKYNLYIDEIGYLHNKFGIYESNNDLIIEYNQSDEFNLENFKTSLCEKYNLHIDELGNVKFGINVVMSASGNVNFSAWHMGLFSHSIFMFDDEEAVVIDSNAMADEFEKGFDIMHGHIIEIYTKCGIKIEGE